MKQTSCCSGILPCTPSLEKRSELHLMFYPPHSKLCLPGKAFFFEMSQPLRLFLLLCICSSSHGANHTLEMFIKDIIVTWKLLSPTLIVDENMLEVCKTLPWVLCLGTNLDNIELSQHLEVMHKVSKHDGIIIATDGEGELLQHLDIAAHSIFRSNHPIFMPIGNSEKLNLRLDSNIMFFEETRYNEISFCEILLKEVWNT